MWALASIWILSCLGVAAAAVGRATAPGLVPIGGRPMAAPMAQAVITATTQPTSSAAVPAATDTVAPSPVSQILFFEARRDGRSRILTFVPGDAAPQELMTGDWEDRQPAVSPDGSWLAFSSNRDGAWDLYLMDLDLGSLRRLTDTPWYEGYPTWSPDGKWIACESTGGGELDIWILSVDGTQPPIQLGHPGFLDRAPAWDPSGRRIAFASDGGDTSDIFYARLDDPDNRFVNMTSSKMVGEDAPAFSPDGTQLAYAESADGLERLMVVPAAEVGGQAVEVGPGGAPVWSPEGGFLLGVMHNANGTEPILYRMGSEEPLPGLKLGAGLAAGSWAAATARPPGADAGRPTAVASAAGTGGTPRLVNLQGVSAPQPVLTDRAADAFAFLRARTLTETGWDFLASLDQAMVGLNDPLPPGYSSEDWLYTGRAFAFSTDALQAGWVEVVREDIGGRVYWRIFVRTVVQDGRRGMPLRDRPWDFAARFGGDPALYDAGGVRKASIPQGYYVDFTQLALDSGFERVPAMPNWRSFYPGAMFTEFVLRDGLTWRQAILELYPPEAVVTPTSFRTPTLTPSRTPWPTATPWWNRWRTATPKPSATPAGPP